MFLILLMRYQTSFTNLSTNQPQSSCLEIARLAIKIPSYDL